MGFDTLAYARRLESAGVEPAQAEAHADALQAAISESVATKADLQAGLADLKTGLAELKAELTWRAVGVGAAFAGLVIAAVKLIP